MGDFNLYILFTLPPEFLLFLLFLLLSSFRQTERVDRTFVSINNKFGILTLKHFIGGSSDRYEYSYDIPFEDAQRLMNLCKIKVFKQRFILEKDENREIMNYTLAKGFCVFFEQVI